METTTTGLAYGPVDMNRVTRAYNGLNGCACGCGGDYANTPRFVGEAWQGTPNTRKVNTRVSKINANLDRVTVYVWGNEACYELESESGNRVTRVYVDTTPAPVVDIAPTEYEGAAEREACAGCGVVYTDNPFCADCTKARKAEEAAMIADEEAVEAMVDIISPFLAAMVDRFGSVDAAAAAFMAYMTEKAEVAR